MDSFWAATVFLKCYLPDTHAYIMSCTCWEMHCIMGTAISKFYKITFCHLLPNESVVYEKCVGALVRRGKYGPLLGSYRFA